MTPVVEEHVGIIPRSAGQGIVALSAVEDVIVAIAGNGIVGVAAGHVLDASQGRQARRGGSGQIHGYRGSVFRVIEQVRRGTAGIDVAQIAARVTAGQRSSIREVEGIVIRAADEMLDGIAGLPDAVGRVGGRVDVANGHVEVSTGNVEAQFFAAAHATEIEGILTGFIDHRVNLAPMRREDPAVVIRTAIQGQVHCCGGTIAEQVEEVVASITEEIQSTNGRGSQPQVEDVIAAIAVHGDGGRVGGQVESIVAVIPVNHDRAAYRSAAVLIDDIIPAAQGSIGVAAEIERVQIQHVVISVSIDVEAARSGQGTIDIHHSAFARIAVRIRGRVQGGAEILAAPVTAQFNGGLGKEGSAISDGQAIAGHQQNVGILGPDGVTRRNRDVISNDVATAVEVIIVARPQHDLVGFRGHVGIDGDRAASSDMDRTTRIDAGHVIRDSTGRQTAVIDDPGAAGAGFAFEVTHLRSNVVIRRANVVSRKQLGLAADDIFAARVAVEDAAARSSNVSGTVRPGLNSIQGQVVIGLNDVSVQQVPAGRGQFPGRREGTVDIQFVG